MRLEVKGADKLDRVAKVLAGHGEAKSIRRRVSKAVRDEAAPITKDQRAALAARLPHRGGLAATVASQGRFSVRTSLASGTVTIVDSWKGHDMAAIDRGVIRRPLFGDRRYWYTQPVPGGLLTQAFMRRRRNIQVGVIRALDALAEEIAKET